MKTLFENIQKVSDKETMYQASKSDEVATRFANKLERNEFTTIEDFIEALTPAKRKFAAAVIETYRRIEQSRAKAKKIIGSESAYLAVKPYLCDLHYEVFFVVALNQSGKILGMKELSSGGIDATYVDIRLALKYLIQHEATQCIIAHNHPSGCKRASREDQELTRRFSEAVKTIGIRLIDHIIVAADSYYSFADEGMI